MNAQEVLEKVKACGFETVAPLDVATLHPLPEVRAMCADNKCHVYGRSWACPPACGTVEECAARIAGFRSGVLVQSVGELEDEWDFEGMKALEETHKKRFIRAVEMLRETWDGGMLPLAAGTCGRCKTCAYPDAPCRFPKLKVSSMEAYGLLVNDICTKNGVPYYYGKNKLAYTSCILF